MSLRNDNVAQGYSEFKGISEIAFDETRNRQRLSDAQSTLRTNARHIVSNEQQSALAPKEILV